MTIAGPMPLGVVDDSAPWRGVHDHRLRKTDSGKIIAAIDNVVAILENDPAIKGAIAFDDFSGVIRKRKPLPWSENAGGAWTDDDESFFALWLAREYRITRIPERELHHAFTVVSLNNRFHEVREYLEGLRWDGNPRVRYWLSAYCGAEASAYCALAGAKFLVAACARVMRAPVETKVDTVLILEGEQNAGKSTVLRILFSPWFTDAGFELNSTDGYQIIRGMWGVELAELDSFNRAEASKSKAFFSRSKDRYRNPYGRRPVDVVRQCVFGGTVNNTTYLKDDTGNRRYWPVRVGRIDLEELAKDRDQLFAEALKLYEDGTPWHVIDSERPLFTEQQDRRYIGDAYEDQIVEYLAGDTDTNYQPRDGVTTGEILTAIGVDRQRWSLAEQQRIGRIMARLGWERAKAPKDKRTGARTWRYYRPKTG